MYCIMNEFIMCEDLWNTKKAQLFKRIMIHIYIRLSSSSQIISYALCNKTKLYQK